MENPSNISRTLLGDNLVVVIDIDKIISDFPRTGLNVDQVINYLERGILLNGDYYRVKEKEKVFKGLLK